jgi:predicted metalloprotease with PDZ domain
MDLLIRQETGGRVSLDDVMRELWVRYGKTDIGLSEGDIEKIACDITGIDLNNHFELFLYQTDDPPLQRLLESVGIGMDYFPAIDKTDVGGLREQEKESEKGAMVLGAQYVADNRDIKLTVVHDNGAAQKAGLSAGDVIVAVDGIRIGAEELEQSLRTDLPDKIVKIHAFRRDELMVFIVTPEAAPNDTCRLWIKTEETDEVVRRRSDWLSICR